MKYYIAWDLKGELQDVMVKTGEVYTDRQKAKNRMFEYWKAGRKDYTVLDEKGKDQRYIAIFPLEYKTKRKEVK